MLSDWRTTTLGELLGPKGYVRGPFGSALRRPEMKATGIPVYEQQHAIYGTREFRFYVDEEKHRQLNRFTVRPHDLIISCSGTLGRVSVIEEGDPVGIISQALLILRPDTNLVRPRYLYYVLSSPAGFHSLVSVSSGSVQVNLAKREIIEAIDVYLPSIEEQDAVVDVLGALDDKIELNRRMNATLEAMAQAVFKEWFVDGAKEEWEEKTFGELLETNVGGDWGQDVAVDDHTERVAIIRGADFPDVQNQSRGKVPIRFTKPSKLKTRKLQPGDLVLEISGGTKDRPTGRCVQVTDNMLGWFDEPVVAASFCRLLRPKAGLSNYLALHMDYIYRQGKTWSYQNVSTGLSNFQTKEFLQREMLPLPPTEILDAFNAIIDPITAKRTTSESMTLAALRDTLLPKLMRGEVRVKEY